jgi:hypothetical protein
VSPSRGIRRVIDAMEPPKRSQPPYREDVKPW